jgi:ABC-type sugar transport system ATPase subunit
VTAPALLRLEEVLVRRGGRTLLTVDAIEVRGGETLAILGPTGAGKTTLLRVMNALVRPDRGRFLWRGQETRGPVGLDLRRRMAMAFQEPLLFHGTVFDNVAYGLALRGVRGEPLRERVTAALELLDIDRLAQQSSRTLSGGEAQRTALARALVLDPELLLLDEPLASLDPPTRDRLGAELRRIVRDRGLTCAWVTHDQTEAQEVADRIAVLDGGEVLQVGPAAEVFQRPATARVARFVGTRNLLAATAVATAGERVEVVVAGSRLVGRGPAPAGAALLLCVRPEEIVLHPPGSAPAGAINTLSGAVSQVRPLGATVEVGVDCGVPLVALVTRRAAEELAVRPGAAVTASFRPAATHLVAAD